jgi:hypothetical protein
MLSYDIFTGHFNAPLWREVVAIFQAHVASRYAGEKMADYVALASGVTQSAFESVNVVTNWTPNLYLAGAHTISSQGTLVTSKDGSLTAGIFIAYNNKPLSSGDHYLVVEKTTKMDSIRIWQPLGNDTQLTIERPSVWPDPLRIYVYAVARDTAIQVVKSITVEGITFDWQHHVAGAKIVYYALTSEVVVAVEDRLLDTPVEFRLYQNYPNPVRLSSTVAQGITRIPIQLTSAGHIELSIFNLLGQKIATVFSGSLPDGKHEFTFAGSNLPVGVYFYKLEAEGRVLYRKMVVQ